MQPFLHGDIGQMTYFFGTNQCDIFFFVHLSY